MVVPAASVKLVACKLSSLSSSSSFYPRLSAGKREFPHPSWANLSFRSAPLRDESRRLELSLFRHYGYQDSYNGNVQVSVAEAKNKLPALIKRAESGERVTICRRGEPVADLVRSEQPGRKRRKLGTLTGKTWESDPDWWKPMTEEEATAFLEGRY